jgi:hypothetical protein
LLKCLPGRKTMSLVTMRARRGDRAASRRTASAYASARWWRPREDDPRGREFDDIFCAERTTHEPHAFASGEARARLVDCDRIGIHAEVALEAVEVVERVAGSAADVEHDAAPLRPEHLVERPHVDAADDARPDLVVDERMAEDLAVEREHASAYDYSS